MKLNVNGREIDIPVNMAEDRLLWVLRDHAGLNGPKYGCGAGACGACTIHIDGEAQRSCLITAQDATGKLIVTLEGIGSGQWTGYGTFDGFGVRGNFTSIFDRSN